MLLISVALTIINGMKPYVNTIHNMQVYVTIFLFNLVEFYRGFVYASAPISLFISLQRFGFSDARERVSVNVFEKGVYSS